MAGKIVNKGRRRFIKWGALGGAGLLLGVYFKAGGEHIKAVTELWQEQPEGFFPSSWLHIGTSNIVTVRVNHTEMGQGVLTALPMILAEELEADWNVIRAEVASPESVYKNPAFKTQMTAASTSVRTSWDILRRAGATAREMLVAAAAMKWGVAVSSCRAEKGQILHVPSGRGFFYGELVEEARRMPIPKHVPLKPQNMFKIIGKPIPRIDTPSKTEGSAVFGIDVKIPGLLTATVVHPPVPGAKLKAYDSRAAKKVKGVRYVLSLDEGVAVVGDSFWQTQMGVEALNAVWEPREIRSLDSEKLSKKWAKLSATTGKTIYEKGDADDIQEKGQKMVEAVYEVPYQAHATPEPMNCTAFYQKDRCDIWAPTQHQDATQEITAKITGLSYKNIHVHTPFVGGGFGRRIMVDYVAEAVKISMAIRKPVKVIWSREEDLRHDCYRPASLNKVQAMIDDQGLPSVWTHRIVGPDHMAQRLPDLIPSMLPYWVPREARDALASIFRAMAPRFIAGKKAIEGASPLFYHVENVRVDFIRDDPGIPTGFWRSVSHSSNAFVVECFMDEIAASSGRDPIELREALLQGRAPLLKVLNAVKEKSNWGRKKSKGISQGVAVHDFHDTALAMVAEVSVDENNAIAVNRMICAVECGIVVNPGIVESQIHGGIAFGLTAALKSSVTIKKGRVEQSNFDDFPLLRMDEMPECEVYIMPSTRPPSGIGEAAVPLVAPAVANAIFSETGKRVRTLPISI